MARDNPVQFAVTREDPRLEASLLQETRAPRVLLVASGGCTALTLQSLHPDASLILVDPNAAQLDLVRQKVAALALAAEARRLRFNIGADDPAGLSQCGNFESLFRGLRGFLWDFVAPPEEWRRLLAPDAPAEPARLARVTESRFWPVAFGLFFADALLHGIFGPDATRHAEPGSYPAYFQRAFERGLARADAGRNYFLHHVLLGSYLEVAEALPVHLARPAATHRLEYVHGPIEAAADRMGEVDLINLSNIFDWSDEAYVAKTARLVAERLKPGAAVLFRQLNNRRDFRRHFGNAVRFDDARSAALLAADRSLFYSAMHVGWRR